MRDGDPKSPQPPLDATQPRRRPNQPTQPPSARPPAAQPPSAQPAALQPVAAPSRAAAVADAVADDAKATVAMDVIAPHGARPLPPPHGQAGPARPSPLRGPPPRPVAAPKVTRLDWTTGKPLSGRYVMIDKLGEGGMGTVYLAEDLLLRRKVAVKALWDEDLFESQDIERFRKEVALAHAIHHPNVARTYDLGEMGGVHFLTMEYLRGHTLMARIKEGPLSSAEVMAIAVPLCQGLQAAHKAGVVHRDLKPANIMLTKDERKAVIMDFGIAASVKDGVDAPSITRRPDGRLRNDWEVTSAGLGTPVYMAPEQWDQQSGDQRTDIYALGVILYASLTGEAPYFSENVDELGQLHRTAPVPDVTRLAKDCDPLLARLIRTCLAKRPEDRPQSMDEVLVSLQGPQLRRAWLAQVLLGSALSAAALFLIGFALYQLVASSLIDELRPSMRRLAELTALQLQAADLDLIQTPKDTATPAFARVHKTIEAIRARNPEARYFYVMRPDAAADRWVYVYDQDYEDRDLNGNGKIDRDTDEQGNPPGTAFDGRPFPGMTAARRQGHPTADKDFIQDDWRVVLSGYSPLPAGQTDAPYLVGVDATSEPLSRLRQGLVKVLSGGQLAVMMALAWLFAPQRRIKRALKRAETQPADRVA